MPRINRAIELLESGQPVYYTGAGEISYEGGLAEAATWADFLLIDYEHRPFDMTALREFMRGLVDAGPTRSGHRMPAIFCTLPASGKSASEVLDNQWQITHLLNAGVHGLVLCRARDPEAVKAFVDCSRFVFCRDADGRPGAGLRGNGGQQHPAEVWGMSPEEYLQRADPWPLNPAGELLLGLKLEDQDCAAAADECLAVPGVAYAEWGPGDMGMSFGYPTNHDPPYPPEMDVVRLKIKAATQSAGLLFLMGWDDPDLSHQDKARFLFDDQGVKIVPTGPSGVEFASVGRRHTGRRMPV